MYSEGIFNHLTATRWLHIKFLTLKEYDLYPTLSISLNNICSMNKYYSLVFDSKLISTNSILTTLWLGFWSFFLFPVMLVFRWLLLYGNCEEDLKAKLWWIWCKSLARRSQESESGQVGCAGCAHFKAVCCGKPQFGSELCYVTVYTSRSIMWIVVTKREPAPFTLYIVLFVMVC